MVWFALFANFYIKSLRAKAESMHRLKLPFTISLKEKTVYQKHQQILLIQGSKSEQPLARSSIDPPLGVPASPCPVVALLSHVLGVQWYVFLLRHGAYAQGT